LDIEAIASSEIWGGLHTPSQCITGGENDSWMSRPGIQENTYEVNFEPISLDAFTLTWVEGKKASKFEVSVKFGKFWKVIYSNLVEADDPSEESGGT